MNVPHRMSCRFFIMSFLVMCSLLVGVIDSPTAAQESDIDILMAQLLAQRADADVFVAQAVLAYDEGRYSDALELLDKALKLDPQDERGLYYKGLVYLAQKQPDQAVEPLEAALQNRPTDLNIQYQLGVAYFALGDYDKASPLLETVYDQKPNLENLGYYVGFMRYRQKQYNEAVKAFETDQSSDPQIAQLNRFYRGLAYGVLGLPEQAISELQQAERTITVSPFTQASVRVREALTAGQAIDQRKRLRLQVSVGGYYDDNVSINPNPAAPIPIQPGVTTDNNQVIAQLRARPSTSPGFLASVLGDYSFFRQGPWEATVTGSFFQTVNTHANLDIFNITDILGGLSGFYRGVLPGQLPYQLSVQFTYDYLFLDLNGFLQRITPTVSATFVGPAIPVPLVGSVGNLTTILYRWQDQTFFREPGDDDIRFGGEVRDGFNNMIGLIHAFRFAQDQVLLRIGYQYDNESTKGQSFSYSGNRLLTGGQALLPWGEVTMRYDYEVHWRAYKNNQLLFTDRDGFLTQRYDIQQTHLVQIVKPLPFNFSFTAQYQGIRNGSKIPVYDYSKDVFTGIVTWTY